MKRAFTLIELLVVVLIIGILAAAAMPQYNKAVDKSRAAQLKISVKAIADADNRYFLVNDAYASKLGDLDIDIGGTPRNTATLGNTVPSTDAVRSFGPYEVFINWYGGAFNQIVGMNTQGKYKGSMIMYTFAHSDPSIPLKTLMCVEGSAVNPPGSYCNMLGFLKLSTTASDGSRFYTE